jgi:mannose-1-phosphate guanylyltransferase
MRAVILAGGEGTRLRPLTLSVPKPVVPIADRPFLRHQLDMLRTAGITEVVFSLGYRPEGIRAVFGDGSALGMHIIYAVEDTPLGTGGAVKNAEPHLDERTVVFNGDVLTDVDLGAVVSAHAAAGADATLVLTPVANPSAYGLVETDERGRVLRFIEKPDPAQITTDTINAGIYVLETRLLGLMPEGQNHSIERAFFPRILQRGDHVRAHVHRGYWIDIGTPEKYLQVHRDILSGRFPVEIAAPRERGGFVHATARVDRQAELEGPFFIGPGCTVEAFARVGPGAVLVANVSLRSGASVADSVLWDGAELGPRARVERSLLGPKVKLANDVCLTGTALGEDTTVTAFSRAF